MAATNVSMLKVISKLVNFRFYNEFLMANERTTAKEIRDEYVETMSKMYYSYFKSYQSKLMKLQVSATSPSISLIVHNKILDAIYCSTYPYR